MIEKDLSINQNNNISPLVLAFMGDVVYEFLIRKRLIEENVNSQVYKLHMLSIDKVKASAQSRAYDYLKTKLTDQELEIMKRGRNAHNNHCPKNSTPIEYHKATGLESLFGFLFFNNNYDRLSVIFDDVYNFLS